jgi:hypothetical protein
LLFGTLKSIKKDVAKESETEIVTAFFMLFPIEVIVSNGLGIRLSSEPNCSPKLKRRKRRLRRKRWSGNPSGIKSFGFMSKRVSKKSMP